MRVLVWVHLQALNVGVRAGHHHDDDVCELAHLQDCKGVVTVDLYKDQTLLLAAHVGRTARVRTEVGPELIISCYLLFYIFITYLLERLLVLKAVLHHFFTQP